jgi:cob(I)alamin adenosyltransferase
MDVSTRKGDDGTTGLYGGGRVRKDSDRIEACGAVDEAQAALGVARAAAGKASPIDPILVGLERDLWVLMAELATDPANAHKLVDGTSRVTAEMVASLEADVDAATVGLEMPKDFVVPGEHPVAAALDVARTVIRRAERRALAVAGDGSFVVPYLNRLSDACWTLARWQEGQSVITKTL